LEVVVLELAKLRALGIRLGVVLESRSHHHFNQTPHFNFSRPVPHTAYNGSPLAKEKTHRPHGQQATMKNVFFGFSIFRFFLWFCGFTAFFFCFELYSVCGFGFYDFLVVFWGLLAPVWSLRNLFSLVLGFYRFLLGFVT
jgi:hypothetical protein